MTTTPHLAPEALAQRYALLCESTRPEPDERMLAYSVEQGLQALDKLLSGDLRTLARQGAPDDFADIHQALLRELERLREFCAFPALANKLVVAFGGGFSAGKSSLINALLGQKLLVTEVDPTTSLPTYLLHGSSNQVSALNLFGHRVALSEEAFLSLTHDEALLYGSHISRLLRAAFITRTDFAWPNLALIDTPGYSKDQSNGQTGAHSERTDEHIARAQLNAAQAVVWVIDARKGCITEDDLAFLGSLQRNIPLFIAISRADQKPEAEIPGILSVIAAALKGRNIPVVGMAAFSARKPRAWPLEPLLQQFKQWNEQASQPQLAHSFEAGFARYDQFLAQQHTEAQDELNRLNRILALSDHRDAQAEATHLKARAQTRLQALKTQGEQLETLWQTFGTQLAGLGKQVGMALPAHGVLRKAVAPVQPPATPATLVRQGTDISSAALQESINQEANKQKSKAQRKADKIKMKAQKKAQKQADKIKNEAQKESDDQKVKAQIQTDASKLTQSQINPGLSAADAHFEMLMRRTKIEMELEKAKQENDRSLTQQVAKTIPAVATGVVGAIVAMKLFEGTRSGVSGMSNLGRW